MIFLNRLIMLMALAALISGAAFAHKQKAAVTEVSFNLRTGMIEVAHRFIIHDAEHAISDVAGERRDLIHDEESQAFFADYVASHFDLTVNDRPAKLTLLGGEIEGGHIWIYQEAPAPFFVTRLALSQSALTEVWQGQVNTVNIRTGSVTQTLTFNGDSGLKPVELPLALVWAG
ncbi:MAG: DUF6702 family protein [Pseudomonadota bacterium]